MSKTFCLYPFTHIEIKNDGSLTPCCRMEGDYIYKERSANILKDDIDEILKSDHANKIRKALLKGKRYPACFRCWRDEDLGLESQRVRYNRRFKDYIDKFKNFNEYELLSYDLKLGNTCNQMCVICSPHNSSMIATERKINLKLDWYRNKTVMDKLYASVETIQHIEFYGGEPWLIKQHWEFLEHIISSGKSQEITLNYATNGSIYDDRYFIDIFSKFKNVSILYSADATFNAFEYCRYPAKWETFDINLKKGIKYFNENIRGRIGYTVSIYSVFDIIDSLEYYSTIHNNDNKLLVWFNIVNEPMYNVCNLPDDIKEQLIFDIENKWKDYFPIADFNAKTALISEISKERSTDDWKKFVNETRLRDKLRNISIINTIPQFKKYF